MQVGDIVKLKNRFDHSRQTKKLIGVVVAVGEEHLRMYGDGVEIRDYADVRWFDSKYPKVARFSPPRGSLEVVSAVSAR